ncbi:MAG TPA: molybdenum ABC transporter ATP-binding protein [Alphaproteobacteria bacterium]|jgi:molybdate transport system ATP-binding protein|nr:molybdenum ABC transporter ATP-binding protein [Alphaproteobacteria bacterium]
MSSLEFSAQVALGDFRLDAAFTGAERVTALFGPSGAGKSTILRLIAGLLRPDEGRIVLAGRVVFDSAAGLNLPAAKRRVGLVFQDGLLFPHLSVSQNLLYGPWARRAAKPAAFERTVEILDIAKLLDRAPRRLSGGERQRVAIGRALLSDPAVLLMDEPVSAVDQERRAEILPYLASLTREFPIPMIYVSHAMEEVERLAEKVVRIRDGRIEDP